MFIRKNLKIDRKQTLFLIFLLILYCSLTIQSYGNPSPFNPVSGNLFAAAIISDNRHIVVGERGSIYLSEDGAETWRKLKSPTLKALFAVCFPDGQNGWIFGQSGTILYSGDSGNSWKTQPSGTGTTLFEGDFMDSQNGFAVGADSTLVKTTDGGRTWTPAVVSTDSNEAETYTLFAVIMVTPQAVCIAGEGGRILASKDAGITWSESQSPLYDKEIMEGTTIYAMAADSDRLYAVGLDGSFIYSDDRGRTWATGTSGLKDPDLYSIDVVDGIGLAAGTGGYILQTLDKGSTWQIMTVPETITSSWISGLDLRKGASGELLGLIAGQNGALGRFSNGKLTWQPRRPRR